jgi:hypothetical protein
MVTKSAQRRLHTRIMKLLIRRSLPSNQRCMDHVNNVGGIWISCRFACFFGRIGIFWSDFHVTAWLGGCLLCSNSELLGLVTTVSHKDNDVVVASWQGRGQLEVDRLLSKRETLRQCPLYMQDTKLSISNSRLFGRFLPLASFISRTYSSYNHQNHQRGCSPI